MTTADDILRELVRLRDSPEAYVDRTRAPSAYATKVADAWAAARAHLKPEGADMVGVRAGIDLALTRARELDDCSGPYICEQLQDLYHLPDDALALRLKGLG